MIFFIILNKKCMKLMIQTWEYTFDILDLDNK
jgi:hypothetical protein